MIILLPLVGFLLTCGSSMENPSHPSYESQNLEKIRQQSKTHSSELNPNQNVKREINENDNNSKNDRIVMTHGNNKEMANFANKGTQNVDKRPLSDLNRERDSNLHQDKLVNNKNDPKKLNSFMQNSNYHPNDHDKNITRSLNKVVEVKDPNKKPSDRQPNSQQNGNEKNVIDNPNNNIQHKGNEKKVIDNPKDNIPHKGNKKNVIDNPKGNFQHKGNQDNFGVKPKEDSPNKKKGVENPESNPKNDGVKSPKENDEQSEEINQISNNTEYRVLGFIVVMLVIFVILYRRPLLMKLRNYWPSMSERRYTCLDDKIA